MQAEQQWRRQRCDDVLGLLLGGAGDGARLLEEARQLGLKPQLSRTPCLLELAAAHSTEGLAGWLASHYADSWCVSLTATSLLWCRPAHTALDAPRLLDKLAAQGWPVQRMALAAPAMDLHSLRRQCRRVADLLAYGRDVLPDVQVLPLERYRLPTLLWRHRSDDALEEWIEPLQRVVARDSNGQLLATLRAWCEHDGQSQNCADALGIHRNSLRYRMERVAEISGLDPMSLQGMLALYIGVQLLPLSK